MNATSHALARRPVITVKSGFLRGGPQDQRAIVATHAGAPLPQPGQPKAEKSARQWSMQFETRCLLRVLGPARGDDTGRKLLCIHERGNGEELGTLCAVLPWNSIDVPAAGALIEVAGLVATCSNGRYAPLVRLEISRWSPAE